MQTMRIYLVISAILLSGASAFTEEGLEGQQALDFSLKSIDGKVMKLADFLTDGPVLLDFWATWCVPCKQALPYLAKIHEKYKDRGFKLVSISTDNTKSVSKVRPYVKSQKWEFEVLLDTDNEVLKKYRGNSIPLTVLISSKGKIVKTWVGFHPGEEEDIESQVKKLLEEKSLE